MSQAHGLSGAPAPRDWPVLTLAELAPILRRYPAAGAPLAVTWHSARPFAASAVLRCDAASVFVKRHDTRVRTVAGLLEEHAFIAHLRRRGAAVPQVLATAEGLTAVSANGRSYEVHALGDGEDAYRDAHSWTELRSQEDAAAVGRALAALHQASAGFTAPPRQTRLLVAGDTLLRAPDLLAGIEHRQQTDPMLRAALADRPWRADAAALRGWHAALRPHLPAMAPLWVHGDFHASNLLWRQGSVSAVLDFGLCNTASAVFDLATAIERNAIAWLDLSPACQTIGRPALALSLLDGYDSLRPRPPAERRALRHVLPLVHVDFALSELAYFHGVLGSRASADAAYSDFLLGHASWFASDAGAGFLAGLGQ